MDPGVELVEADVLKPDQVWGCAPYNSQGEDSLFLCCWAHIAQSPFPDPPSDPTLSSQPPQLLKAMTGAKAVICATGYLGFNPAGFAEVDEIGTINLVDAAKKVGREEVWTGSGPSTWRPRRLRPSAVVTHDPPFARLALSGLYC